MNEVTMAYSTSQINKEEHIWLWHHRLVTFINITKLFPVLCNEIDLSKFVCEECHLAKSHKGILSL